MSFMDFPTEFVSTVVRTKKYSHKAQGENSFLDSIASPGSYPCQPVQWFSNSETAIDMTHLRPSRFSIFLFGASVYDGQIAKMLIFYCFSEVYFWEQGRQAEQGTPLEAKFPKLPVFPRSRETRNKMNLLGK